MSRKTLALSALQQFGFYAGIVFMGASGLMLLISRLDLSTLNLPVLGAGMLISVMGLAFAANRHIAVITDVFLRTTVTMTAMAAGSTGAMLALGKDLPVGLIAIAAFYVIGLMWGIGRRAHRTEGNLIPRRVKESAQ